MIRAFLSWGIAHYYGIALFCALLMFLLLIYAAWQHDVAFMIVDFIWLTGNLWIIRKRRPDTPHGDMIDRRLRQKQDV